MTSPLCIHFTSFKQVRPKDKIVNDAAPDIHSPLPFIVHLSKPLRIFNKPVMRVPQINFNRVCKGSIISKQNILKEIVIILQLINCELTKI
jgi:hypothetical protein